MRQHAVTPPSWSHVQSLAHQWPPASTRPAGNGRVPKRHDLGGESLTVAEIAAKLGLKRGTVQRRLNEGIPLVAGDLRRLLPRPAKVACGFERPALPATQNGMIMAALVEVRANGSEPDAGVVGRIVRGLSRAGCYRMVRSWRLAHGLPVEGSSTSPGRDRVAAEAATIWRLLGRGACSGPAIQEALPAMSRARCYRWASAFRYATGNLAPRQRAT